MLNDELSFRTLTIRNFILKMFAPSFNPASTHAVFHAPTEVCGKLYKEDLILHEKFGNRMLSKRNTCFDHFVEWASGHMAKVIDDLPHSTLSH